MSERAVEILGQGHWLRLVQADGWEWVERRATSRGACVVALTPARELVLVEQWRVPLAAWVIELPAGLVGDIDPDEDWADAARRELLEETGYEADEMTFLCDGPSSAGLTTETYALLLSRGVQRVGPGGGDEHEQIHVHCVPLGELEGWLADKRGAGRLVDPKIYAGLWFVGREG
jgi:ADP-ribose pyrophosphatase